MTRHYDPKTLPVRLAVRKREEQIAKQVGLTRHRLQALSAAVTKPNGRITMAATNRGWFVDHGFAVWAGVDLGYLITDAGRELVRQARELGW